MSKFKTIMIVITACFLFLTGCNNSNDTANDDITLSRAKEIVLKDTALSSDEVTFIEETRDTDNNLMVYTLVFRTATTGYTYQIDVNTGKIIHSESSPVTPTTLPPPSDISFSKAQEIALAHAGLTLADVTLTETGHELKDNGLEYNVEFHTNTDNYDYKISAQTGDVISFEKEKLDAPLIGNYITIDKAKEIALEHANLSISEVTFIKAERDDEDGIAAYEIEFAINLVKYEYSINATTGDVISFEKD